MNERDVLANMHDDVSNYIERLEGSDMEGMEDVLEQAISLLQSIDTAQELM